MDGAMIWLDGGIFVATAGAAAIAWWQAIEAVRGQTAAEKARDAAVRAHQEAAAALKSANAISSQALAISTLIDERQREFRAVEWDAEVTFDESKAPSSFKLTNVGDTDAISVTLVLYLNPDKQTHRMGNISARTSVEVTSPELVAWMRDAIDWEVVHPAYRVHWSSPLGQVSDEKMKQRTVDDFIRWDEQ